jgi:hypothetical protein
MTWINEHPDLFSSLRTGALVCAALSYFWIGLRGILAKCPFVLPGRRMSIPLGAVVITMAIEPIPQFLDVDLIPNVLPDFLVAFPLVGFLVLVAMWFLWLRFRGLIAIGVTESSLWEGLAAALQNLRLPWEERQVIKAISGTLRTMRLKSLGGELQVLFTGNGTAQIRARHRNVASLFPHLLNEMNYYYARAGTPCEVSCCAYHIALGLGFATIEVVWRLSEGIL